MYHPNKPQKIRVVFDCSAKYKGISLNDTLLPGPDITNKLLGVLIRFRSEVIAIEGDIKSMFHQIQIPPRDRDKLRFLWWENGELSNALIEYRMCVYLFGTVCSPSCANFALKQTAVDFKGNFDQNTIDVINNCFYVDDCLASSPSVKEAERLLKEVSELLMKGGFKITKWVSNNREVIRTLPKSDRSTNLQNLDLCSADLPKERALGLWWDAEKDTLCFRVQVKTKPLTRRGILSVVNSIYDPLGFGAPVIQPMKLLLQSLCKIKLKWDDPIPSSYNTQYLQWIDQLPLLDAFQVARCYKTLGFGKLKQAAIHHFADASEKSYGYVSYLRLVDEEDNINVSFLLGKTRLVPLKTITVPRLELCAATISVRLDQCLRRELNPVIPLEPSLFWSDSTTVLRYIRSDSQIFHTFVANRVQLIRDISHPDQWRYVPSHLNPADHASRGLSIKNFLKCSQWKSGPTFLMSPESCWPEQPTFVLPLCFPGDDPEIKKGNISCFLSPVHTHFLDDLFDKYSSWFKILKVCAWILRFVTALKSLVNQTTRSNIHNKKLNQSINLHHICLEVQEIKQAELVVFAHMQSQYYNEEIKRLSKGKLVKRASSISKLNPFLEGGILRVGGRIKNAPTSYDSKHQIIIPNKCRATHLIIKYIHCKLGHVGRQHVLSYLRQNLWITQANSAVRSVLSKCIACRKNFRKVGSQQMADLPEERLTPNKPPFSYVGVDYFGPFMIRSGRSDIKRYGVIFTCLTIRAVHIEIASTLDTSSFIQALRRFIARRGQVTKMWSDNGTNFVGGERELRESLQKWNKAQIHDFLLQRGIDWVFNSPGASHHGGVWERQIRTVRKILASTCQEQRLSDQSLSTLMCEVESIINSRPLTTTSDDPNDLDALTPNDLLLLKRPQPLPPGVFEPTDCYSRKQWRQVQYLADVFWSRWIKEYLPILQKRNKWSNPSRNLSLGDVVLVAETTLPRNAWLMGRIIETFPDSNGLVRTARIQTKHSIITRPITKLCVIVPNDQN